jgi:uncharacterized protein YqeY
LSISEAIEKDLVAAMKAREALRVSVLRMTKSALKNKQIELRRPLSPEEEAQVLQTLVKQRTESIETFEKGGRSDLATKEAEEREMIRGYLPEAIGEAEVERAVSEVISELKASSAKDIGAVMKEALARLKATGKTVDGKAVNAVVRAKLS